MYPVRDATWYDEDCGLGPKSEEMTQDTTQQSLITDMGSPNSAQTYSILSGARDVDRMFPIFHPYRLI